MAGEIMSRISAKVKPHLRAGGPAAGGRGRVVLGTVKGDIHDIGKDIVGSLLEASGFEVVDLGVDVPAESVVAAVRDNGECIVALSCLLTTGFDSMKATIEALDRAGLRDQVRVMVGPPSGRRVERRRCDVSESVTGPHTTRTSSRTGTSLTGERAESAASRDGWTRPARHSWMRACAPPTGSACSSSSTRSS